jgi:hypothetical protein
MAICWNGGQAQQPAAPEADGRADWYAKANLLHGETQKHAARSGCVGFDQADKEHEKGDGQPVTEARLGVERLANARWHPRAGHDELSQAGVGGGQNTGQDARLPQRQLGKDQRGRQHPEQNGQWQANDHQTPWQLHLASQDAKVGMRGPIKEHDGIGDLGQDQPHWAFHVTPDLPGGNQKNQDAGKGKDQRYREDGPLEPSGEQAVYVHQQDEQDHSEHRDSPLQQALQLER